ncbi:malonyl-CoA decarboxylase, mitochondrial isoform X2 [Gossypium australe]|uniref:Malonyl-CoA decarboxylase, mitochondrial isoform X2 n=1 Tax=Gossypium australe TaxID=47621 RepID=A0A5B6WD49_9ROSI|nr:malonyl-CoA decarboxylase, mitochondrial isoform X2 [Gossypium australe]
MEHKEIYHSSYLYGLCKWTFCSKLRFLEPDCLSYLSQPGLAGINLGKFLIKRVITLVKIDMPHISVRHSLDWFSYTFLEICALGLHNLSFA